MELSYRQKEQFYEQGYLVIPGVVPRIMVDDALKAINHSLGQGIPQDQVIKYSAQTYSPELTQSLAIADLYNRTPALTIAESAIGAGCIRQVKGGQIALRFPAMSEPPSQPRAHLDGMYTPTNGVKEGTIGNFTALLGVLLSELKEEFSGNFTVWPGSHFKHEAYFREHGPQSLLNGMPPVDIGSPVQIMGQPGDIVLVHYLLAHSAAQNESSGIRYAIFFRLTHVDNDVQKWDSMTDVWLQWAGVHEIVAEKKKLQFSKP